MCKWFNKTNSKHCIIQVFIDFVALVIFMTWNVCEMSVPSWAETSTKESAWLKPFWFGGSPLVDLMIPSKDPCRFSRKQEVGVVLGGQAPPTSGPTTMGCQASLSYISHPLLLLCLIYHTHFCWRPWKVDRFVSRPYPIDVVQIHAHIFGYPRQRHTDRHTGCHGGVLVAAGTKRYRSHL